MRGRRKPADVETQRIAPVDLGARNAGQIRLEPPVELDRVHVRDALREEARQHTEAGADLQHDVVGREPGEPSDHAQDVLVDEEVLPQGLARRDVTAHRPNTRVAFSSILRSSAVASTSRT